jgi:hypothetical protein
MWLTAASGMRRARSHMTHVSDSFSASWHAEPRQRLLEMDIPAGFGHSMMLRMRCRSELV